MFKVSDVFDSVYMAQKRDILWDGIDSFFREKEDVCTGQMLAVARAYENDSPSIEKISSKAKAIVKSVRADADAVSMIDALMQQYSLNTEEGVLLMCLAEALIRVPDTETADAFIKDRLCRADWSRHLKKSDSLLVNASTWGLLISGKVLKHPQNKEPVAIWNRLTSRMSEPVIRKALGQAMKILGNYFVLGQTIKSALGNGKSYQKKGYTYSFDMLGEAALTADDAAKYMDSYCKSIEIIGQHNRKNPDRTPCSISIKLSALHPRYEMAQHARVLKELGDILIKLVRLGRKHDVGITIDAEEADRLEISLKLFEQTFTHPECKGWGSFGLVVQAYSKRALPVLTWLYSLAKEQGDPIPLRLVKGAYWDSEIKHAQEMGEKGYPIYTRKESTDLSYLTCARFLLQEQTNKYIFPQFATHNPHTIASVLEMAGKKSRFEFQRLHGMGDSLYKQIMEHDHVSVRIYAPVGNHKDLLPYLVRRLLENGANTSFVHRLADAKLPVEELVEHPLCTLEKHKVLHNPLIPLPEAIFPDRKNSAGMNIAIEHEWQFLSGRVSEKMSKKWAYGPMINGQNLAKGKERFVVSPFNTDDRVGSVYWTDAEQVKEALSQARAGFEGWNGTPVEKRARILEKLSDLLEENMDELVALCHREAGKTAQDSIDEIREAVDFCRYYGKRAQEIFGAPQVMPGPTGESDELFMQGRGVFLCISPWNFPLAIFMGQVVAALAAGNSVLAKPAEQTSLIAGRAVELAWQAGVPGNVLQLLPGDGATIGGQLLPDNGISGVAFTGSTDTAMLINRTLAARKGPIIPFVAETGGQNAMIVDSTALPEQVVTDVVRSSFASAGQRCSALRVLYVQKDIADRVIALLQGAMNELEVGDPSRRETDVGPVIDEEAACMLQDHINRMEKEATLIARAKLGADCKKGHFIAPAAFRIDSMSQLEKEHFGPILHVVVFDSDELDKVIDEINGSGYGLTLGVHSRNESVSEYIGQKVNAGNVYINRNQVGAVVGVQPFGGMGLSGTGPKAGGPHYLYRFGVEKHLSINTTAIGGNASLMAQGAGEV